MLKIPTGKKVAKRNPTQSGNQEPTSRPSGMC